MAEPTQPAALPLRALDELVSSWRASYDAISAQALDTQPLFDEALADADSEEGHANALQALSDVRRRGRLSLEALDELMHHIEDLRAEWRAARRYDADVLAWRMAQLAKKLADDSRTGAQEWLAEVFDALDALQSRAVERLTADDLTWPDSLQEGARRIREDLRRWNLNEHAVGLELMEVLGEAELDGWERVLSAELRSRAYRFAAWISLRRLKRPEWADRHLGYAIGLWPHAGRMHAERAAYYLSTGDLDRAATDAQRSVELAKDDHAGYLELGIWAELSGDFDDADQFYSKALALMPTLEVARLNARLSLIDPPGRLLNLAAKVLLDRNRPRDALRVADQALQADMRGSELYPQVTAHLVRSLALEQLEDHLDSEAAKAAVDAGKLYVWNGDVQRGIEQFERALELDDRLEQAGWLLADAKLTTSLPLGAVTPDQAAVAGALQTWEQWAQKIGPPAGDTSWAYLTRAVIADLATQHPGANRLAGIWGALMHVEKAIVHDAVDAQRWGYASQYLRYVHLEELAFEAADRGYRLGAGDRQVLAERMPQLANRGRFDEAERVAEELVTMFGNDPWVSAARAWLTLHSDRPTRYADSLALLDLPLAEGNDPSWYYDMRALCHVALGNLDAAREDFRALLTESPPFDGTTKCRLAVAAVALSDVDEASRWSNEASHDPTTRPITCLAADAFAALARDDVDGAIELLSQAAEHARSAVELQDIVETTLLRLPLLSDDRALADARQRTVEEHLERPIRERERLLAENPPDPDRELEAACEMFSDGDEVHELIRTTLRAVQARRHVLARRFDDAASTYQCLLGSAFEPEATIGLMGTLQHLAEEQAAVGEVEQVRALVDRATALGDTSHSEAANVVASALERAGRYAEAREQLETAITTALRTSERTILHQRAGGVALAEGDLDHASTHFLATLDLARESNDQSRIGQVQTRMALVAILRDDLLSAGDHLLAAVRAWREAGALEPAAALIGELRGLRRVREGDWETAVDKALELVQSTITAANDDLGAALAPLKRELT
jgi:tetratricopeptide (TPR) repeat protein